MDIMLNTAIIVAAQRKTNEFALILTSGHKGEIYQPFVYLTTAINSNHGYHGTVVTMEIAPLGPSYELRH